MPGRPRKRSHPTVLTSIELEFEFRGGTLERGLDRESPGLVGGALLPRLGHGQGRQRRSRRPTGLSPVEIGQFELLGLDHPGLVGVPTGRADRAADAAFHQGPDDGAEAPAIGQAAKPE